jgi:type IV pilus assembly protein PilA
MNNKSGFTLIELMIVVAIIGILASLAIPDFLKFQAKSRQSEAKMNLGALWTTQKAYYGEYSTFAGGSNAFDMLGYSPMQQQKTYYSYIIDQSIMWADVPAASLPDGVASSNSAFTLIAAGNIDKDAFVDVWGMNDAKIIRNMVPTASAWTTNGNDVGN